MIKILINSSIDFNLLYIYIWGFNSEFNITIFNNYALVYYFLVYD